MNADDTLYGRIKNRILTISGNNPSIRVDGGYLVVSDGPVALAADHDGPALPVKERMVTCRFRRANCPIDRLIVTRPDGFITFNAIRWLHYVGCALVQLDWDGTVLLATAPDGPDRPAVRRAQALAAGNETGLAIMREILRRKLSGQAQVARLLGSEDCAELINRLIQEISETQNGTHILAVEAAAAGAYWELWVNRQVHFARQMKVPDHWQTFGLRRREGSSRARKATTPGGALLNYLYGILAGEMKLALLGAGLDPGIGIFHADRDYRASLVYDAMEAARPYIDVWLLSAVAEIRFSKRDFFEEADGTIRISRPLTSHLAMTAPLWRRAAEMVAGWLAGRFAEFARRVDARDFQEVPLPTPLPNLPSPGRPYRTNLSHDTMPRACHECGRALAPGARKFCSASCAGIFRAEMRRLIPIAAEGQLPPAIEAARVAEETRSTRLRSVSAARREWDEAHGTSGTEGPRRGAANTRDRLREWYVAEIQPRLSSLKPNDLVRIMDVSRVYARNVIRGQVPHPRHFAALAAFVGVTAPKALKLDPMSAPSTARRQAPMNLGRYPEAARAE